jgi:hypothetical protein
MFWIFLNPIRKIPPAHHVLSWLSDGIFQEEGGRRPSAYGCRQNTMKCNLQKLNIVV